MTQDYSAKWWAAFICIAFIEAVLLILLISRQPSPLLFVAIIALAFLLFLIPQLDDVISLTFDRGKLESKINTIGKKLATTKSRTDKLFLLSMSKSMYENLKKLAAGSFGSYQMNDVLERELYYLKDIGYIEVGRIRDIPYEGSNLSEYVKVTDSGKQFIELRKSAEEESKG
ncbi:hypothetical protein [Mastigocladopsis repens]|uniref:hypothetical protein n=1 Tax=Mastigocladopsis repens TaxID=221287 RepID=UPI0002DAA7CF|nr:hypothetical protein [Mastigocladopsis repens]